MITRRIFGVSVLVALLIPQVVAAQQNPVRRLGALSGAADTTTATALSGAFRAAASRALPAVVFIAVEQRATGKGGAPPDFFGFSSPQPTEGTGSGFIIDAQGHIMTNNHVVADAARLTVRLMDGREYVARLVGSDVSTDIAVLKIDARAGETLPTVTIGDSDALRVGDWVLALGNPLGLDFTVTAGIVSAKGRQISRESSLEAYIQTDAAINPGNSGGPMIDLLGRVVGINSAIFGSDRFIGYGFAVPIRLAQRVTSDLLQFGYLKRPLLGVLVGPVQAVDAELYNLKEVRGAFVSAVDPQGPAARGGLRPADIVLALNTQPVTDDIDMITRLTTLKPNDEITLTVLRGGRQQAVKVVLGEFERAPARPAQTRQAQPTEQSEQVLGFSVRDLNAAEHERLKLDDGVLVIRSAAFSMARQSGIQENTIVLAINGQRVQNAEQVRTIAQGVKPGSAVSVTIYDREYGEKVLNYRTRQ